MMALGALAFEVFEHFLLVQVGNDFETGRSKVPQPLSTAHPPKSLVESGGIALRVVGDEPPIFPVAVEGDLELLQEPRSRNPG